MNDGNQSSLGVIIVWFYIIIFVMTFLPACVDFDEGDTLNNPFDYARITDVDYKAELIDEPNNSGKVRVTEKLTYDIHAASQNNLFWELWRDLPEDWVDGLHVNYDVISVKEITEDGYEKIYTESPKLYWYDTDYVSPQYGPGKWYHSVGPYDEYNADYEAVFFYVDGLYREQVTFELVYEMNNAALKYRDISELYLTLFSEDSVNYLNSFDAQILIPDKDMPRDGNYRIHTLGTVNESFEVKESDTMNPGYHTFYFNLDKEDLQFKPYNEYLDFILWSYNEDSQIFTTYAPDNMYSNDVARQEIMSDYASEIGYIESMKVFKLFTFFGTLIVSFLVIVYLVSRDKKYKSMYNIYQTPDIIFYRDIPSDLDPHFISKFIAVKEKNSYVDDANGYSAVLLSLVRKDYIDLVEVNNPGVVGGKYIDIVLKYRPQNVISSVPTTPVVPLSTKPVVPLSFKPVINTMAGQSDLVNNNVNTPTLDTHPQTLVNQPQTYSQVTSNTFSSEKVNDDGKVLEELTRGEELYFNLIVKYASANGRISMNLFQRMVSNDLNTADRFVTDMDKILVDVGISKGYFQKKTFNEARGKIKGAGDTCFVFAILSLLVNLIIRHTRIDFAYGGFFILGIILLIGSYYLKKLSLKYVLLTQIGEQEYAKWKGLYNFLNSATLMNERTHIELPLWEKYLVYATAFGISEKVVKALEIRCPDLAKSAMLSNGYCRSSSFRSSGRSFRSSARGASHSSRSGGGSYYGGGGRGGGGGGGGH